MKAFIDEHKGSYGVEPICKTLPIAPSTYYEHAARQRDAAGIPRRAQRDVALSKATRRIWEGNFPVYIVRTVWQRFREGVVVARCVVRLMTAMGLKDVIRGKSIHTTISNKATLCPLDPVNRQFHATRPNALWVNDSTYVSTWQDWGVRRIDAFSRRVVGWKTSSSAQPDFVLDALDQEMYARRREIDLIHHSDRGAQYVPIRYTERLADAGIEPSVGSVTHTKRPPGLPGRFSIKIAASCTTT